MVKNCDKNMIFDRKLIYLETGESYSINPAVIVIAKGNNKIFKEKNSRPHSFSSVVISPQYLDLKLDLNYANVFQF